VQCSGVINQLEMDCKVIKL